MSAVEERREEREKALLETIPPRLPWVLLCHQSGGNCGRTWTVNTLAAWRPAVEAVIAHEKVCTVLPRGSLAL